MYWSKKSWRYSLSWAIFYMGYETATILASVSMYSPLHKVPYPSSPLVALIKQFSMNPLGNCLTISGVWTSLIPFMKRFMLISGKVILQCDCPSKNAILMFSKLSYSTSLHLCWSSWFLRNKVGSKSTDISSNEASSRSFSVGVFHFLQTLALVAFCS